MSKLVKCHPSKYTEWLYSHLSKGNMPTHYYDYSVESGMDRLYMAVSDFNILPLYGAKSIKIIIPKGIKVSGYDTGHSSLYFEDQDYGNTYSDKCHFHPCGFIPVFADQDRYFKNMGNHKLYDKIRRFVEREIKEEKEKERDRELMLECINHEEYLFRKNLLI